MCLFYVYETDSDRDKEKNRQTDTYTEKKNRNISTLASLNGQQYLSFSFLPSIPLSVSPSFPFFITSSCLPHSLPFFILYSLSHQHFFSFLTLIYCLHASPFFLSLFLHLFSFPYLSPSLLPSCITSFFSSPTPRLPFFVFPHPNPSSPPKQKPFIMACGGNTAT